MRFVGQAVTLPMLLTYAGKGGQIILSETAWDSVKATVTQHPGAVHIISLGKHELSDDFPQPMLLMEVMPTLLSKRTFRALETKKQIEPGYRDAPCPKHPMAIVFAKVRRTRSLQLQLSQALQLGQHTAISQGAHCSAGRTLMGMQSQAVDRSTKLQRLQKTLC
jgi:hypothetical protein